MLSYLKNKHKNLYNMLFRICVHPYFLLESFLKKKGMSKNRKQIEQFKNKFNDKRCFIIATGPSITIDDLIKLKSETTFGVNAACLLFDEIGFATNFFVITDHRVYEKMSETINRHLNQKILPENVFISDWIGGKHKVSTNVNEKFTKIPIDPINRFYINLKHKKFSSDIGTVCYDGSTVVFNTLQIAVYMGFKEIYLLGTDCNYSLDKKYVVNHGIKVKEDAGQSMIDDYKVVKRYADKNNIKIYNATRGGMLEVFERVDLDDILDINIQKQNNDI